MKQKQVKQMEGRSVAEKFLVYWFPEINFVELKNQVDWSVESRSCNSRMSVLHGSVQEILQPTTGYKTTPFIVEQDGYGE